MEEVADPGNNQIPTNPGITQAPPSYEQGWETVDMENVLHIKHQLGAGRAYVLCT